MQLSREALSRRGLILGGSALLAGCATAAPKAPSAALLAEALPIAPPAPPPQEYIPPAPPPPAPPPAKDLSAAGTPRGNPGRWATNDDYPARAMREERFLRIGEG